MQPLIGILAGMGPRSTAPFIDLVVTECQQQYGARDDMDFPKMMICSQPAPFYEDRPTDHAALEAAIREGLQHLERTGADFLAIACNTAHIYYPQLAASVNVPLLNMVDLAVAAIPAGVQKVALIAARPTAEAEIYQAGIRARGIEVVRIDWQHQIDHLLGLTRITTDTASLSACWDDLMQQAITAGAELVVVACLDLSALLSRVTVPLPLVDASHSLAQEIVRQWRFRAHGERQFFVA